MSIAHTGDSTSKELQNNSKISSNSFSTLKHRSKCSDEKVCLCSDVALALMTETETLEDGEFLMNTLANSKTPNSFSPTYEPIHCPTDNGTPPVSVGFASSSSKSENKNKIN
jgi:hypothetical protein